MSRGELLSKAVQILRQGGVLAFPTETVYGLGADAENELSVRRIFAIKGRPSTHPLIVHLADSAELPAWAREVPEQAKRLASAFWPGPLTLVLHRTRRASDAVTGGQDTVALRVPSHPLARELLFAFGGGVAAPSANRFGRVSPTTADHVRAELGTEVDQVLDGGPCSVGLESTIVDMTQGAPLLLRPGGISKEALEDVLGGSLSSPKESSVRVPGLLPSHYAPRAGLLVVPATKVCVEAQSQLRLGRKVAVLSVFRSDAPEGAAFVEIPLDTALLARRLYSLLREVDASGVDVMVVALPTSLGMGLAVQDRLLRAAAPRG